MRESWHRHIRALARYYPTTEGAVFFSRLMGRWADAAQPQWLVAEPFRSYPRFVLNVATLTQRKVFYFASAYGDLYFKRPFARLLRERLRPGGTFIDVGANLGAFTWLAAAIIGESGRVIAFEPDPGTFESLRRTVEVNGLTQVTAMNLALSDRTGELRFFRARDGFASSLVAEAPGNERRYVEECIVRVAALDDLPDLGVTTIDLVKIDVEGEEARTVAGMRGLLERAGRPPIWCEVRGPRGSTRAPDTFSAVCAALAPLRYAPYRWDTQRTPVMPGSVVLREDILFEVA